MCYKFKILHSKINGYALFKWDDEALFWSQYTKWYKYLGNLIRFFHHEVYESSYYSIVEKEITRNTLETNSEVK